MTAACTILLVDTASKRRRTGSERRAGLLEQVLASRRGLCRAAAWPVNEGVQVHVQVHVKVHVDVNDPDAVRPSSTGPRRDRRRP